MNDVLKITFICDDYPTTDRPTNVFVEQLVNSMVDSGKSVNVVAPQSVIHNIVRHNNFLPKISTVSTKSGNKYRVYRPFNLSFGGKFNLFKPLVLFYNRYSIIKVIKNFKTDVLYAHFWHNSSKISKYARENNIPLFVACGEGDDALDKMIKSISYKDKKELVDSITGVISVSSENKRKCVENGLVSEDNIIIEPNCVNTNIFYHQDVTELKTQLGIKKDDFSIIFVGSFIPRKGPDRLAKAISNLNDKNVKVMFIGKSFAGYDYDFDCEGIVYKGIVNHDDLPKYLNCADIFVLPTLKEGCCNAIVEALACGIPVISSNRAFNDDILDDTNSIRVDPLDICALTEAIAFLRDNKEQRIKMKEVSLDRHQQYSIYGRALRILDFIYKKI